VPTATMTRHDCLTRLPATFTYTQARKLGLSDYTLYRLRDDHLIEPLGRGLYERTDLSDGDQDLLAIVTRAPRATLCLRSALVRHGLIDDIPAEIDIALPRGTRSPALDAPVSWHHFDAATFDLGREELDLGAGRAIGLYSPERCIIDAFRLSGTEGPELGNEALRRWLRQSGASPASLLKLAAQLPRAEASLRRSLQILL
jgi:Transcriptional regulator, AbiEi antitoxin